MIVFYIDNFNTTTASLGEHRVRELNDEINKLNKTKSYWDSRIIELGGGDQGKGRKFYDVEGAIIFFKYMSKYIFFSHELLCSSYIFMKIFFHVFFCIYLYYFILCPRRVCSSFVSLFLIFSVVI